jgi:hypothetical protein
MSSCEIEQDTMGIQYGEKIMNAGWNPAVALICELLQLPANKPIVMTTELPEMEALADVSTAISLIFMKKMYTYQR